VILTSIFYKIKHSTKATQKTQIDWQNNNNKKEE